MTVYIGDDALTSRLMIGDLAANSSFCHKRCSTNLFNEYTKKRNDPGKKKIDIDQAKEGAWDKVFMFMNETPSSEAESGLEIHDLGTMHLEYLSEYARTLSLVV